MAENSNFNDRLLSTSSEKSFKRRNRNESEKRRRDAFNRIINELRSFVASSGQKMDKSSVLKCTINFLKRQRLQVQSTSEVSSLLFDSKLCMLTGCTLADVVKLYMDALAAGTFCMRSSGHIEYASTSFARLFDKESYEIRGVNLFHLLDDVSSSSFTGTLSAKMLQSSSSITEKDGAVILQSVTTRETKRELLIAGYLKKIPHKCSVVPNTVSPNKSDESTRKFSTNEATCLRIQSVHSNHNKKSCKESKEASFIVGIAKPLSYRPEIEGTLETWESRNTKFTLLYNSEFTCVDTNGCQQLGYQRLELLGTSGYDYIHADDLLRVAENHMQLIKLGHYDISPHRLQAKSRQWVWVNCTAIIESRKPIGRIRCIYRVLSTKDVKKFRGKSAFKTNSNEISSFSPGISDCFTETNTACSSQHPRPVSSSVCSSSFATPSPTVPIVPETYCCTVSKVVETSCPTTTSCMANITVEPLPYKRSRKLSGESEPRSSIDLESSTQPSCQYSSPQQQSSTVPSSPSQMAESSVRHNRAPVAFIEHYPLPLSRISGNQRMSAVGNSQVVDKGAIPNTANATLHSAPVVTTSSLSISSMYRQVWEELQRRSELLRQQVLQKEMELRDLHLQKFIASVNGVKY